jgi:hypothetical protein
VSEAIDRFKQRPPAQRAVAVALLLISLVLVLSAERDLQRRRSDQVRGPKFLWRVVCLNALGSMTYFRWGRRASED